MTRDSAQFNVDDDAARWVPILSAGVMQMQSACWKCGVAGLGQVVTGAWVVVHLPGQRVAVQASDSVFEQFQERVCRVPPSWEWTMGNNGSRFSSQAQAQGANGSILRPAFPRSPALALPAPNLLIGLA